MTKVSKKGRARSFRPTKEADEMLTVYMKKHRGKFNETDILDEAVRCFLGNPNCCARVKFEKDNKISS